MAGLPVDLLGLKVFILCAGLVGNVFLILAIAHTKFPRVKSFDLFLLGLAAANLEEIAITTAFDVAFLRASSRAVGTWSCRSLKFLSKFGEVASIFFTVLISVFRQQKLSNRANLPIYLDSVGSARMASGACVLLATVVNLPVFAIDPKEPAGNATGNATGCPLDFFQCSASRCPALSGLYKYLFILVCNLLPLAVVTVTGCLILAVLLGKRSKVTPASGGRGRGSGGSTFHRGTVAVLAAMGLFQVEWTLYLILQLPAASVDFAFRAEAELLISFSYTCISPYVYGIGSDLFSLRNFKKT
ncbi:uncharacterized protein LOC119194538 [Pungitius pungitius]|uniref:uncharacterized protein LOC119194538 n=1 Tax=Pungitius pungitius TaxID=134920 RepID=UPI002E165680